MTRNVLNFLNFCKTGKGHLSLLLFLFMIFLSGCVSATVKSDITEINQESLSKLTVGMSKRQVSKIMRDKVFYLGGLDLAPNGAYFTPTWTIKNPYRSETVQGKDGKSLEVIYYVTNYKTKEKEISDEELTPLVFEDEKLIGWGWEFFQDRKE